MASAIAALFFCCSPKQDANAARQDKYIDIPAYFKQEIERLQKSKPIVLKTVIKDSISETKEISISNWGDELSSFTTVDLNKPAYAGLLKKDSSDRKSSYTATDPEIDLSSVEITWAKDNSPLSIRIKRTIKNSLYQTQEILTYQRDSIYSLEKEQSVLLLGDKHYKIEASFK